MGRTERILDFLKERHTDAGQGISASELSEAMGIHRSDASLELNKLFRQGILLKTETRPVLYRLRERGTETGKKTTDHDSFSSIIGSDGSIKAQIELAKAAVSYPPHGLHTLIYGESGVGKNLMAESMWDFAKTHWTAQGEIPFIHFNCADYAANEQLLLSQLFGYVKGAFTGAAADREGVVDRARGGILFLDEIHRLPPAGQELLFLLIDKGRYRRLGETSDSRRADIMIIGATSEDITSNLLVTFLRRIPVQIGLPTIRERPIQERINIILHFIWQEAKRLNTQIDVSGKTLEVFSSYPCMANIGGLKNDILLCCAKCYLESTTAREDILHLEERHIPERISSFAAKQTILDESIQELFRHGVLIDAAHSPLDFQPIPTTGIRLNLYQYIDRKLASYRQQGAPEEKIAGYVGRDLEEYFGSVARILHKDAEMTVPRSLIEETIWETAKNLLENAAQALERRYGQNTITALAWHLQQFKERFLAGHKIFHPDLTNIRVQYEEEYDFLQTQKKGLEESLDLHIPEDEIGFLTSLLVHVSDQEAHSRIGLIVVSHGRGAALHMAAVGNHLLGTDCILSYDIPLNRSNTQTLEELGQLILRADSGKGVVLLVDMGFLMTMEDSLSRQTGVPVRTLPNVTTALILEAGHQLFLQHKGIDAYLQAVDVAYQEYVHATRQKYRAKEEVKPQAAEKYILLLCPPGRDTGKRMKELLIAGLPEAAYAHFAQYDMKSSTDRIDVKDCKDFDLMIGMDDPHIDRIPFFSASGLFDESVLRKIAAILEGEKEDSAAMNVSAEWKQRDIYEQLSSQIGKFLKVLPSKPVNEYCVAVVQQVSKHFFNEALSSDGIVRTYLHTACMLDRIYADEPLDEPHWGHQLKNDRHEDFHQLQEIFSSIHTIFTKRIPDGEICYFLNSIPSKAEREPEHAYKSDGL